MISKKQHTELEKLWLKKGAVYQRWNRLQTRMPLFLKHVGCLAGKSVLEFGCNAGIYGYEIAKIAEHYIGIDQGDYYIAQAKETRKFFDMQNARFINKRAKQFLRDQQKDFESGRPAYKINAIFATFVLYHLSDKETDIIEEWLLPRCDVAFIMTRTSKRSPWKSYNKNHFEKPANCSRWLQNAGFETMVEWNPDKKFAAIVGQRPEKEKADAQD